MRLSPRSGAATSGGSAHRWPAAPRDGRGLPSARSEAGYRSCANLKAEGRRFDPPLTTSQLATCGLVTRPNAFCRWTCPALLVTVAASSRPSFAVRWDTRGARHMILDHGFGICATPSPRAIGRRATRLWSYARQRSRPQFSQRSFFARPRSECLAYGGSPE